MSAFEELFLRYGGANTDDEKLSILGEIAAPQMSSYKWRDCLREARGISTESPLYRLLLRKMAATAHDWQEWWTVCYYAQGPANREIREQALIQMVEAPKGPHNVHEGYYLVLTYLEWRFLTDRGVISRDDLGAKILAKVRQAPSLSFSIPSVYLKPDVDHAPELLAAIPSETRAMYDGWEPQPYQDRREVVELPL